MSKINTRITQKCDTSVNWAKATNFTPLEGEIIIYTDLNQCKIGDGETNVRDLPFAGSQLPSEGLAYELSEDETYAICTGIGTCTETDIIIASTYEGKPVTSIGMEAFLNCSSLTSVIVPDSVLSLAWGAFQNCSSLKSITLGDNVTDLGGYVFQGCKSLKNIEIPNGVTLISLGLFQDCSSLVGITIPNNVTGIAASAFSDCSSLTSIKIPNSVTAIEHNAFAWCSNLTSITIPDSVAIINAGVFDECTNLTIYCEATEQPANWEAEWNPDNRPVVWGAALDFITVNNKLVIKPGEANSSAVLSGDYNGYTNEAVSPVSMALGAGSVAGLKGWYYTKYNPDKRLIWLSDTRTTSSLLGVTRIKISETTSETPDDSTWVSGWNKDDQVTIVNGNYKYERCAEIEDVKGNMIKLKTWPTFTDWQTSAISLGGGNFEPDEFSITAIKVTDDSNTKLRTVSSYDKGGVDFGAGSHAEGIQTAAVNLGAHTEGIHTVAYGQYAHAEGFKTQAGYSAHAEGKETIAAGEKAHAEGMLTKALGLTSHAEGHETVAIGGYSHAEGFKAQAIGDYSHAEGVKTEAKGRAHAEGDNSKAYGEASHAEGYTTEANGPRSHAEGDNTKATANGAHAEGKGTVASGEQSHAEGRNVQAIGHNSHAEGDIETENNSAYGRTITYTTDGETVTKINDGFAHGDFSHREGRNTSTFGNGAHTEGHGSMAIGNSSHAEGYKTTAILGAAHAEGYETRAEGIGAHAEGRNTIAKGECAHVEGKDIQALADGAHAEGGIVASDRLHNREVENAAGTKVATGTGYASGIYSHREGKNTSALGDYSHAEGSAAITKGNASHAEGYKTDAIGTGSHAEGYVTSAEGDYSHAEGGETRAIGEKSHAEGGSSIANGIISHAEGINTRTGDYVNGSVVANSNTSFGSFAHAEGNATIAKGSCSHAEGKLTYAEGLWSHAEGYNSQTAGRSAHAEGDNTRAAADGAHAEGTNIKAGDEGGQPAYYSTRSAYYIKGNYNVNIEGPLAANRGSHAEGVQTFAGEYAAHAEGFQTDAVGQASHAEGWQTRAEGKGSHTSGIGTKATKDAQAVVGCYNGTDNNATFIVGVGSADNDRANAFTAGNDGANDYITIGETKLTESKLQDLVNSSASGGLNRIIVETLPNPEEADSNTIYMIPGSQKIAHTNSYFGYLDGSVGGMLSGFGEDPDVDCLFYQIVPGQTYTITSDPCQYCDYAWIVDNYEGDYSDGWIITELYGPGTFIAPENGVGLWVNVAKGTTPKLLMKKTEGFDIYEEYMLINGAFELIGNTSIDLSDYVRKSELANYMTRGEVKAYINEMFTTETWTMTLEDGSTVTKEVVVRG